jgi:hypothetical protein
MKRTLRKKTDDLILLCFDIPSSFSIEWLLHQVNPYGKAGAIQIRRCQEIAVKHYGGTLGALALIRSGFCNVEV